MSSKRYFDPAQAESDHKDLVISQLKAEIYELKSNQKDYNELNSLLNSLQHKYTLLQEEKLRSERDRRQKMEQDQKLLLQYKDEFDVLQSDIRNQNIDIQELRADNKALKEMADFRANEIIKLTSDLQSLELDDNRLSEENIATRTNLRQLQADKKALLNEQESASIEADSLIARNRNLEKAVSGLKGDAQQAEQNLKQLEQFNDRINQILREKKSIQGESEIQLSENEVRAKTLAQDFDEIDRQGKQALIESQQNQEKYQQEINAGKEHSKVLNNIETTIRSKELHIDDLRNNYELLKQKHYSLVDENKNSNNQIDLVLSQIEELNYRNKELVNQIDVFAEQDEKVRALLDRREQSNNLISDIDRQLKDSVAPILHLTNRR